MSSPGTYYISPGCNITLLVVDSDQCPSAFSHDGDIRGDKWDARRGPGHDAGWFRSAKAGHDPKVRPAHEITSIVGCSLDDIV